MAAGDAAPGCRRNSARTTVHGMRASTGLHKRRAAGGAAGAGQVARQHLLLGQAAYRRVGEQHAGCGRERAHERAEQRGWVEGAFVGGAHCRPSGQAGARARALTARRAEEARREARLSGLSGVWARSTEAGDAGLGEGWRVAVMPGRHVALDPLVQQQAVLCHEHEVRDRMAARRCCSLRVLKVRNVRKEDRPRPPCRAQPLRIEPHCPAREPACVAREPSGEGGFFELRREVQHEMRRRREVLGCICEADLGRRRLDRKRCDHGTTCWRVVGRAYLRACSGVVDVEGTVARCWVIVDGVRSRDARKGWRPIWDDLPVRNAPATLKTSLVSRYIK
eukprot:scaffold100360_cov75-Phaeocystis_antarctica.AAC.2